jgi:hypothetical protein
MGTGKRILAGSVLALAVSGIVLGPALAGWGQTLTVWPFRRPGRGRTLVW